MLQIPASEQFQSELHLNPALLPPHSPLHVESG
jgi:hypothetical protein